MRVCPGLQASYERYQKNSYSTRLHGGYRPISIKPLGWKRVCSFLRA